MRRFLKDSFVVAFGNVIAQAISILTIPIITRLYSPDIYGIYVTFLSIATAILPIATLRYSAAILVPKNDRNAGYVSLVGYIVCVILSAIGLFIVFVFYGLDILPQSWKQYDYEELLFLAPVTLLILGFYRLALSETIRQGLFKPMAVSRIMEAASNRTLALGATVLLGASPYFLVIGRILCGAVAWGLLLKGQMSFVRQLFSSKSKIKRTIATARHYKHFPLFSSWSFLTESVGRQAPIVLMAYFYQSQMVAFYALAIQMLSMPVTLIGDSLAFVFLQRCSKLQNNKLEIGRIVTEIINLILALFLPIIFILFSRGSEIFSFVFGPEWGVAGQFAAIISIASLFTFSHRIFGTLFELLQIVHWRLPFDFSLMLLKIAIIFICVALSLDAWAIVVAVAAANVFFYSITLVILFVKKLEMSFRKIVQSRSLVGILPLAVTVLYCELSEAGWMEALAAWAIGILLYAGLVFWVNKRSFAGIFQGVSS